MKIGNLIRQERLNRGVELEQITELIDLSIDRYKEIEANIVVPNLDELVNISKVLNIQPAHFFPPTSSIQLGQLTTLVNEIKVQLEEIEVEIAHIKERFG